jgi:hypothetical protein
MRALFLKAAESEGLDESSAVRVAIKEYTQKRLGAH